MKLCISEVAILSKSIITYTTPMIPTYTGYAKTWHCFLELVFRATKYGIILNMIL